LIRNNGWKYFVPDIIFNYNYLAVLVYTHNRKGRSKVNSYSCYSTPKSKCSKPCTYSDNSNNKRDYPTGRHYKTQGIQKHVLPVFRECIDGLVAWGCHRTPGYNLEVKILYF